MTDTPCPGPCNTEHRKALAAIDEEVAAAAAEERAPDRNLIRSAREVKGHPGKPVWCRDVHRFTAKGEMLDALDHRGCHEAILDRLRLLPTLATALAPGRLNTPHGADVDNAGRGGTSTARGMAHAPSPSPAWDTADELIRWVVSLEDWLRVLVGDDPLKAPRRFLTDAVSYLVRHGDALLTSDDAERVGKDILGTYRRLEHLQGLDRLVHRLTEPCPRCGRKGLRRKDGGELVTCSSCRATWDWEHLEHLARVYADDVRARGEVGA